MDTEIIDKLDAFFSQFKHQTYKKGEILVRADENPSGILYLKNGVVKKYAISRKGEELIVNLFKPISFFPMSWAINDSQNKFFYEAMTTVELWKAPKEQVIEFIKKEPEILYDLISRVYKGTDGMLMRMVYLMSGSAYNRLITEVLIFAKRFGVEDVSTGTISCKTTEKDLASQAGMTRETVSREIKNLKDKHLIKLSGGKLIIPNIIKLEEELSEDFNALSS